MTVIVPGRDIAAFAPAALDSLRAQTLPSWRAILVDDGSVDDTGRIFDAAASADPRFTVLRHTEAPGLGGARNAAFDERLMSGAIVIAIAGVILVVVGLVQNG